MAVRRSVITLSRKSIRNRLLYRHRSSLGQCRLPRFTVKLGAKSLDHLVISAFMGNNLPWTSRSGIWVHLGEEIGECCRHLAHARSGEVVQHGSGCYAI